MERAEIHRRLDKTVEDMKLSALLGRSIFELSGGEKQQIACGSVYTAGPDVYVLDEPSSNLDKKAITRLHETLRRIKDEGGTILVSEHRLYYLLDLADRFLYLDDGIITRSFTPGELCGLPDSELASLGLRCTDLRTLEKSPLIGEIPHGAKPALEAVDLGCSRGNHQILDIDRMSIPEHSIVAMIGDNGCGKSTLTESLCGVIPANGSVAFRGTYLTDRERAGRSFLVMQDVNRQLFSDSVIEEVLLGASVSREEALQVLDDLGLSEQLDRHPASLSGGQKQRVAIASALCARKEILFYDEPTSGLDRGGMERFGALLRQLQDRVTSVIITHDPELILQCCTHILHVENGRILGFYPLNDEGVARMRWYFLSDSEESFSRRREKLGMFGKVLQYAGRYKKFTYGAVAFMIVGALCSAMPYLGVYSLIGRLLDGGPMSLSAGRMPILLVLIFGILYAVTYTIGLQLSHRAAYHTLENLRVSLQEKLEKQPLGNVQELGTGAVKKLFNDDIESIELMLAHVIPEGIANLTVPAVILLLLVAADWQMALLTVILLLFGLAASRQMYTAGMDRMGNYFAASKRLNNTIIEYVSGMEVVRVFNRQGESGSGKTTIANLLARFWDVQEGTVRLRGVDIRKLPIETLMAQISMVFQKVYLFEDTIKNNIAMGRPDATFEEIVEAAKKARCYDFIMRLPYGFDTITGEGGTSLSGGEAQRISIARCILKDAPIIILDEATASVDADNEVYIQQAMSELCRNKTVLVIAHRLNTVRGADCILVLEKGRIVEQGSHDELMAKNGAYCHMIGLQERMSSWNQVSDTDV